jgi:hypothetical protein
MTTNLHTLAVNTARAAAELAEAEAALEAAKADKARWERLSNAASRVKKLAPIYDEARAAHDSAVAAEAQAKSDARFNGLADLSVTNTSTGGLNGGGLLRMSWRISWTGPGYDAQTMTGAIQRHERDSFFNLPPNVMAFLIERHPELIPDEIMALAPGDPAEAMEEYHRARQRGYLKGKIAA